jgi:4'-phosphopantetheinyl transferase
MTKLYYLFPGNEIGCFNFNAYLTLLPAFEQKKILAFRENSDARRSLFGKLLLLRSFSDFNIPLLHLECMTLSQYKKPVLNISPPLYFSISHCKYVVVVAVSNAYEVGVDVEMIEPININDFKNVFGQNIIESIARSPDPLTNFYHYWTRYEAALKAYGKGFLIDLKRVNAADTKIITENQTWYTRSIDLGKEVICSFAAPFSDPVPETQCVSIADLPATPMR